MLCCDGRTSHHVTWFKRLCWQTVQSDHKEKRRSYERRVVEVEHGSFIPVVLSTTGGHGKAAGNLYARIASMLADRRSEPFSIVMAYIRTQLSFALVNAAVTALRGHRHKASRINGCPSITLAVAECNM